MPTEASLTESQRRSFLEHCPDFFGVDVTALARAVTLAVYPPETDLYPNGQPLARRALRVVVSGHVLIVHRRGLQAYRRTYGATTVFGEESVLDWSTRRDGRPTEPRDRFEAFTLDRVIALELQPEAFEEVFGPAGSDSPLLRRLLVAEAISAMAPEIVQTLSRDPVLTNAESEALYALLEGADLVERGEGDAQDQPLELLQAGEIPGDFFVALEGKLELASPDLPDVVKRPAPTCLGLAELATQRPSTTGARLAGQGRVVRVSGGTFWGLYTFSAEFQRAVVRSVGGEVRPPGRPSGEGRCRLFVLACDADLDLPLRGLTDLLAESLASHLYDHVRVLHAVPEGGTAHPTARFTPPVSPGQRGKAGWVEHRWLPVPQGEQLRDLVARWVEEPRERADVTLLDASACGDEHDLAASLSGCPVPYKVVRLFRDPESLSPLLFLAQGVPFVHTAVLSEEPPAPGIGLTAWRARRSLEDSGKLTARLKTFVEEGAQVAAAVGASAKQGLSQLANALAHPRTWGKRRERPTWPVGTTRVRWPRALLSKLRDPGATPASLDALGYGPEAPEREVFRRWARAVTDRRVGVALGGGGTYGDVHIPLLQELRRAGVPVDVLSGSSIGATIGAYYAAAGLEGLELFRDHWFLVLGAAAAGFVSSAAIQWRIDLDLGRLPLDQTDLPFIPVVTDADRGIEWDLRHGTLGTGVRASGSLPPLIGPTVLGDRRYLDGGIVANVPVSVLRDEGVRLIVASNPITGVAPGDREEAIPVVGELWREFNPWKRVQDSLRTVTLLVRSAGEAQVHGASVVYRAVAGDSGALSFVRPDSLEKLRESPALAEAVATASTQFRGLLEHPPSRVTVVDDRALALEGRVGFRPGFASLEPWCTDLLDELAAFLLREDRLERVTVAVSNSDEALAARRAEAVVTWLTDRGVPARRLASRGERAADGREGVTFDLDRVAGGDPRERRRRTEFEAELKRESVRALARALTQGAREECSLGDLDLGRMLALEAASLDPGVATDRVLRFALAREGKLVRSLGGGLPVVCMAWSPDGALLAVGSADGFLRVWDATSEAPPALVDHRGTSDPAVVGVAWSPDGTLVASAGFDHELKVHRVTRGAEGLTLTPEGAWFTGTWDQWGVAFSPDGERLLGTWQDRASLGLFEPGSDEPSLVFEGAGRVREAAWSPDGTLVAVCGEEKTVVWDARTGEELVTLSLPEGTLTALAWHPEGGRLLVAAGEVAAVLDVGAQGEVVARFEGHLGTVRRVAWSPDGARVLTASEDQTARVWDGATGALKMVLQGHLAPFSGVAWHPQEDCVATWSVTGLSLVWDALSGATRTVLAGQSGALCAGAWSPGGGLFATASMDGTVRLWDPLARAQRTHTGHLQRGPTGARAGRGRAALTSVEWHPESAARVVTAASDGSVQVWDPQTEREARCLEVGAQGTDPAFAAWSPKGEHLALSRRSRRAPRVLDGGDLVREMALAPPPSLPEAARDACYELSWSATGRRLAMRTGKAVVVWDVASGSVAYTGVIPGTDVVALAWHPTDDDLLVTGRWLGAGAVSLVDLGVKRGKRERALGEETDGVWCLGWSPDGKVLASGCNDGRARLYETEGFGLMGEFEHAKAVRSLSWSGDGRYLATGDAGREVAVWEREGLARAGGGEAHRDWIGQVSWSRDGGCLVSVGAEGSALVWTLQDGRWAARSVLEQPKRRITRVSLAPTSDALVSADSDGAATVHPIREEALLEKVGAMLGRRAMTEEEWARFLGPQVPRRPSWPRPVEVRARQV